MENLFFLFICLIFLAGCEDNTAAVGFYPATGIASWYDARSTASGEDPRKNNMACAMRKRDFGQYYLVCNLENSKCVVVRHNDFGPSRRLFGQGRIIDLSKHAFSKIADLNKGLIKVKVGQVQVNAD